MLCYPLCVPHRAVSLPWCCPRWCPRSSWRERKLLGMVSRTRSGITQPPSRSIFQTPLGEERRGGRRGEARRGERTAIGRPRFSQFVDERTRVPLCLHKQCICIETIGRTKGTVNLLIPPATDNAIPPPPRTIYRSSCGPPSCFELARCRTGRRKYTCTRVPSFDGR